MAPGGVIEDAQVTARFISTRAYRELYRGINQQQRKNLAEQDFIDTHEAFLEQLGTRILLE